MGDRSLLIAPSAPGDVAHYWEDDGQGGGVVHSVQDVAPLIEQNRAARLHNDGYTQDRTMRRVASVPLSIMLAWKQHEGWDPWNMSDPDVRKRWFQKLSDPDWAALRTADGQLDFKNGHIR